MKDTVSPTGQYPSGLMTEELTKMEQGSIPATKAQELLNSRIGAGKAQDAKKTGVDLDKADKETILQRNKNIYKSHPGYEGFIKERLNNGWTAEEIDRHLLSYKEGLAKGSGGNKGIEPGIIKTSVGDTIILNRAFEDNGYKNFPDYSTIPADVVTEYMSDINTYNPKTIEKTLPPRLVKNFEIGETFAGKGVAKTGLLRYDTKFTKIKGKSGLYYVDHKKGKIYTKDSKGNMNISTKDNTETQYLNMIFKNGDMGGNVESWYNAKSMYKQKLKEAYQELKMFENPLR